MRYSFVERKKEGGMLLKSDKADRIPYQERMLEKGRPPFLAPCSVEDGNLLLHCEGLLSFTEAMKEENAKPVLMKVLARIQTLRNSLEEYLLDEERILWEPEYWYLDSEETVRCVYLPDRRVREDSSGFLLQCAEKLIENSLRKRWRKEDAILFLYRFYNAAWMIEDGEEAVCDFIQAEEADAAVSVPKDPGFFEPPQVKEQTGPVKGCEYDLFQAWDEMKEDESGEKKGRRMKLQRRVSRIFTGSDRK